MKIKTVNRMPNQWLRLSLCLGLILPAVAFAQNCPAPSSHSIFNVSLCVAGDVANVGSNSISDIINQMDEDALNKRFGSYRDGVTGGEFRLDLRSLPVTLGYQQGSSVLTFNVPSLGIKRSSTAVPAMPATICSRTTSNRTATKSCVNYYTSGG